MLSSGRMLLRSLLPVNSGQALLRQAGVAPPLGHSELFCATVSPRLWAFIGSPALQLSTSSTQQSAEKPPHSAQTSTEGATSTDQTASSSRQPSSSAEEPSASAEQPSSSSSSSSSGQSTSSWTHQFTKTLKDGYEQAKSRFEQQTGASGQGTKTGDTTPLSQRVMKAVVKELKDALLPAKEALSVTRVYEGPIADQSAGYSGPSDLVLRQHQETGWQKVWTDFSKKFAHHPLFQRFSNVNIGSNPTYKKAEEMAENLRERWETADHPIVHTVEDVRERYFAPSEAARTMQVILTRDPVFNMNHFIRALRADAPLVVKAFLTHDIDTLSKHCGPELIERFSGIFRHFNEQGLHEDPTILFTSDVELAEMRMVDEDPLVVVQFNCQQLRCTRDKFGNVVEGSVHDIQRVFYFWGLSQERQGIVTADGKLLPPRWIIKDMMWQSMLALV